MRRWPTALLALAACTSRSSPAPTLGPLEVAGCADIGPGPSCEIDRPSTLTLWVAAAASAPPRLRTGDAAWAATWTAVEDGWRARVVATATTPELVVESGHERVRWQIRHLPRAPELLEADALAARGDAAEARLRFTRLSTATSPRVAGEAMRALGRLDAGDGDMAAAQRRWLQSADLAARAGRRARAANERMSAASVAVINGRDLDQARALLGEVAATLGVDDAAGRANLGYYQAVLASQLGDPRGALVHLEAATRGAHRLDLRRLEWMAEHWRSQVLAGLGQHDAALSLLDALAERSALRPCDQAPLYLTRAWVGLLAVESGASPPPSLRADATAALRLLEGDCPQPDMLANMHLNMALLELQSGAAGAARQHLRAARALGVGGLAEQRMWLHDLDGRAALAAGSATTALAQFDVLRGEATERGQQSAVWRAWVGRASALTALGRLDEAKAAYDESRRTLRIEALSVALGAGRTHFLASRRRADQAEVALAERTGDIDGAVRAIRSARAEGLRSLTQPLRIAALSAEARARWDAAVARHAAATAQLEALSVESWAVADDQAAETARQTAALERERRSSLEGALAAAGSVEAPPLRPLVVGPDELVLGYFPAQGTGAAAGDGWLAFAQTATATALRELGVVDPARGTAALARALLAPFERQLAATTRVRFLTEGRLDRVDLHALPWRGQPLIATHTVRYAADVAARPNVGSGPFAVIADPTGDLPAARDEAATLIDHLRGAGREIAVLGGHDVTRARLVALLESSQHLHYAGHGRFGSGLGLDSDLPIAEGLRLSAGDVLLLPRVPARVVLSSCESARTAALGGAQLGLAQAFVIAGADEVVAATRPVPDALARSLMQHLYRDVDTPLELALQAAQRALLRDDPSEDWAAFRLFTP